MTDDAVSPLRRRMIEDMTIRQFGDHTKRDYVRQDREFAMFLGRLPHRNRAEPQDLGRYKPIRDVKAPSRCWRLRRRLEEAAPVVARPALDRSWTL